ncbi:glycerol-3-phosphate 1-O-acyltransferase [soil metagenome]
MPGGFTQEWVVGWPDDAPASGRVVVLADASSRVEFNLIKEWARRESPPGVSIEVIRLAPSRRRKRGQKTDSTLTRRVRSDADLYLLPVRVVWSPSARSGGRSVSWWDVVKLGDPRDPDAIRQRVIQARWPDRIAVVTGAGASAARLVADHVEFPTSLGQFITRRAWRALDRAERGLRGNRYKVPRFLQEEMTASSEFREGALAFGAKRGLNPKMALARARHYLREMAASHSPFLIDLIANGIHWLIKQGYGGIVYDHERVAELNAIGRELPLAFLPAHRSNLDRLSLQFLKWENDLPPNHTAGGINMNSFPVGPLIRRTGVFFIRRTFKENELYKFVLRSYIDYLVENRFPLEWYMEGGRSRSGKLLPPRFGLLAYVVESWKRGKSEDVMLVPVSIVYDQIQDLSSYTDEARGGAKAQESFSWALKSIRSLRRRYGDIHIRFAEPVSVAKAMSAVDLEVDRKDLAKLGLEVVYRIAAVTPITPAAVVSIALLVADGKARSLSELAADCRSLNALVDQFRIPTTEALMLDDQAGVGRVLKLLAEHGNVSSHIGPEPLFYLTPEQSLRASYYRNIVAHHFLHRAILEMALEDQLEPVDAAALWERVAELRDLLKFEFFFPDKDEFQAQIIADLQSADRDWQQSTGTDLLELLNPKTAPWVIRPFLQAYLVVADELATTAGPIEDETAFIRTCLRRGEAYRLRGLIGADGVSTILFRQALGLARNRGLVGAASSDDRQRFAAEVRQALRVG